MLFVCQGDRMGAVPRSVVVFCVENDNCFDEGQARLASSKNAALRQHTVFGLTLKGTAGTLGKYSNFSDRAKGSSLLVSNFW